MPWTSSAAAARRTAATSSRCRCGRGEPSPGAVSPFPAVVQKHFESLPIATQSTPMHSSPSTLQHAASGVCVQHATRAPVASRTPSAESMPREQPRLLCAVQCARPCRHETGARRRVRANDPIKPSTPRQQQRKHRRLMRLRAWARPAAAERGYLGQYSQGYSRVPCEY
jgi:hypothetical protein